MRDMRKIFGGTRLIRVPAGLLDRVRKRWLDTVFAGRAVSYSGFEASVMLCGLAVCALLARQTAGREDGIRTDGDCAVEAAVEFSEFDNAGLDQVLPPADPPPAALPCARAHAP